VSTNVSDTLGNPFPGTRRYRILPFRTGTRTVRVGLLAVTLDSNRKPYVRYADPVASLRAHLHALRDSADVWVALTHLGIEQDIALAEAVPELDLLVGTSPPSPRRMPTCARYTSTRCASTLPRHA
jgi:2',3'-cyclic-nucleotide 2'-phosphodiesterase (5'-nucleotidase family)